MVKRSRDKSSTPAGRTLQERNTLTQEGISQGTTEGGQGPIHPTWYPSMQSLSDLVDRNGPNSASVVSLAQHHWQKPMGQGLSWTGKERKAYNSKLTKQTWCFGLAFKDVYVIRHVWQPIGRQHKTTSPQPSAAKLQASPLARAQLVSPCSLLIACSASPPPAKHWQLAPPSTDRTW